ncbi:hypothetical protein GCM10009734_42590 [Nonomuraea bangladeshensis]
MLVLRHEDQVHPRVRSDRFTTSITRPAGGIARLAEPVAGVRVPRDEKTSGCETAGQWPNTAI